ncbi:GAF domain-containing protein [Myxococcus virescens]|uniref:GAF domain-containing protein n=1 Tax=Myxococcus virescens TaxID=83456 RepID=UPI003DA52AFC
MEGQAGLIKSEVALQSLPIRPKRAAWSRRMLVGWYGFTGWMFAPGWVARMLQFGLSFLLLAMPAWKLGWTYGVLGTIGWVVTAILKIRNNLAPRHLQLVHKKRIERQLLHLRLIERMQEMLLVAGPIGEERRQEYCVEVLQLIASYVRSHRSDEDGKMIHANLLGEKNGQWCVLARDERRRLDVPCIPKESSLAWQAFASGEAKVTGDVFEDFPGTPTDRPYRSILAIPVFAGVRPVAVVTIDSTRRYHFDSDRNNLVTDLNPFVAMLGWTQNAGRSKRPPQLSPGPGRSKKGR